MRKAAANVLLFTLTCVFIMALMLALRTLVVSVHRVDGNGLLPLYANGDRLLINRCSYGLRIAGGRLLPYSRLMRQPVRRGDIVAFLLPDGTMSGLMIARCKAVPGDTISTTAGSLIVPGTADCADSDYYWLEAVNADNPADSRHIGLVAEKFIVGRVVKVLYSRNVSSKP